MLQRDVAPEEEEPTGGHYAADDESRPHWMTRGGWFGG
jgi:hypothetical protein